jgi:hypothetical protein
MQVDGTVKVVKQGGDRRLKRRRRRWRTEPNREKRVDANHHAAEDGEELAARDARAKYNGEPSDRTQCEEHRTPSVASMDRV